MNLDPSQDYNIASGEEVTITAGGFTFKVTANSDGSAEMMAWVIGTEPGGAETAYGSWRLENKTDA